MTLEVVSRMDGQSICPVDSETKLFICLSGTSESGKSEFGKLLFDMGYANRIKYLRVAREIGEQKYGIDDPFIFLQIGDSAERRENAGLIWEAINRISETNQRISVIETFKHPHLLHALASTALNISNCVVYIDASFELRLEREAIRIGKDTSQIREEIIKKDGDKLAFGIGDIKDLADVLVINNGEIDEYRDWVVEFADSLRDNFPDVSGKLDKPIEYS